MTPDVERIIDSVAQRDQDTVQVLLDSYNTQQRRLEEFRRNKVRDCASDSDSDADSSGDEADLVLRQRLATALLGFVGGDLQPAVLRVCLQTLRILSRDRRGVGPMVTDRALGTLAQLGGVGPTPADQSATTNSQIAASGCEEAADASSPSPSFASSTPVVDLGGWAGAGSHGALVRGKRDGREEETDEVEDGEACEKEAMKVLCNVIYNSPRAQERASALRLLEGLWESLKKGMWRSGTTGGRFYKLRMLFLLTALRPELRVKLQQDRGVPVLTEALEQSLAVTRAEGCEALRDATSPPVSREVSQDVVEILKTLFNITHRCNRQEPDEESAAVYRHLAAVLRHCLLVSCDGEDTRDELQGHTVNVLSALPLMCLDVLLSVGASQASHRWEGVNMDCVHALVAFMDRRLSKGQRLKEKLTPVLNLLTESSRVHRETRHYLRQKILPPLTNVATRPEQDASLRGQLVRLMTHVDTDVKHCAAELLFVLCKENVSRFVKYTGYGNAAGLLAARGLLNGRRNSGAGREGLRYSSDSDSDTEEYREARARINVVTGRVEAEQPDPMEGMTEEEKEEEARRLIAMIDRLSRDRIIQPMGVTVEGKLRPLWGRMRESPQEEDEDDEEGEEVDLEPGNDEQTE